MITVEKTPTGIAELDRLLNGGVPKGSATLIAGGPGTGKTITAAQFLYNGATVYNEKGLLVSFNESAQIFKRFMLSLGWDFERLEKEGKIKILDFISIKKMSLDVLLDMILEESRSFGAKRMVVDSITALTIAFTERVEVRATISLMQKLLRRLDCTSFLIAETPWGEDKLGSGIEEFVADGIIKLETLPVRGELRRRLMILKMRGTSHDMKFYQYVISERDGIVITPYPEVV
ncbi:MAG: ATPase domain-containing protein [Nitrososphaeria archaeon]